MNMEWLKRIAPKKFLFRYPLQKGAKAVGIFMACGSLISLICFLVELSFYKQCENCSAPVLHSVYGFSIIAILYCTCMFFINLWFIWAVKHEKSSIVLCWVVITSMWGLQGSGLVFVLLCMNITDFSISWIVALVFAIIGFLIFIYCVLIGYGYWLELKKRIANAPIMI